ncbi:hypothetical protein XELAEV_18034666mg [Xenopus laevis]|uniref:Uncharacterized protein n=1 Tax=Xenopus laevis TaxID=8355 RepID=A0A974HBC6_XENLA|nr:hypothetical protein XELAEV_18034666mg [Xenopus laevis]
MYLHVYVQTVHVYVRPAIQLRSANQSSASRSHSLLLFLSILVPLLLLQVDHNCSDVSLPSAINLPCPRAPTKRLQFLSQELRRAACCGQGRFEHN